MSDEKSVSVQITGRVQGVWYRGWTRAEAQKLGLRGWVRNERDGSVSAVLCGPAAQVDEMLRRMWQGPGGARVDTIETQPGAPVEDAGFEVRR
ncbi:acylphosphatase [Cribrihabitans marinus]|uniref:acylphosphatase n=1 Tax=Cribrihabitans marinus TaxID=1227549 RepID=A0A1H6SYK2_9RHOB|nr:acylphosphatase [Cribrihabitans marinus]GGH22763.1 acylphosphatase [Cribrihabitans marinus]SEI72006.1 acylphosphatase [Cribrihabitans marinus]